MEYIIVTVILPLALVSAGALVFFGLCQLVTVALERLFDLQ